MPESNTFLEDYEVMFIFSSGLTEKETENQIKDFKKQVSSHGGEIVNEDIWGLRDLAYRIKKEDQGFYAVFQFTFPPEALSEYEKALNINSDVLRYMFIKLPKHYEFKTLAQYEDEFEKEEAERKKAEKEKEKDKPQRKPKPAPKKAPVKKIEKDDKPEDKPVKKAEKKEETSPEDMEKKLKSIVDDPDISI